MSKMYDVIVIGAGPAGLSAALYAGRARLKTLVVEKKKEGGQIALTSEVENYPGCVEGESGSTLIDRMYNQAKHFGAEFVYDEIESVDLQGSIKQLNGKKDVYKSKAVIVATGASSRPIGCPGEKEFIGYLKSFDEESLTLENGKSSINFSRKDIAIIKSQIEI